MVPEEGLEPSRTHVRQILSLLRLPLRHSGRIRKTNYSIIAVQIQTEIGRCRISVGFRIKPLNGMYKTDKCHS